MIVKVNQYSRFALVLVFLVTGTMAAVSSSFRVSASSSGANWWNNLKTEMNAMSSSGDTMYVDDLVVVKKIGSSTLNDELSSKSVVIMIENGGELRFQDGKSTETYIKLGSGSKVVVASGGKLTAEAYDGKRKIIISSTVVSTASGNATGSDTDWTSTNNYTDPNGTLPSYPEAETAGGVDGSGALPVTWGYIELKEPTPASVTLNWCTMSEMNNNYFEVQQSVDGVNWEAVERKTSDAEGGNSSVRLDYSTVLQISSPTEVIYFRIKQVDFDGKFDFSKILVYKPQSSSLGKDPIVATLGGGVIKVTGNYYTQLAVYAGNGQLVWSNEIGTTTEIKLENSGAHWLVFRNRAGSVLRVKHMVNYE